MIDYRSHRGHHPKWTWMHLRNSLPRLLLDSAAVLLALVWMLPVVWMFSSSLRPGSESFSLPPRWLPTAFHFENYITLFTGTDTTRAIPFELFFLNSTKIAVLTTCGQLLTCSMGAFAFARLRFPGRDLLFLLLLSALMVPSQVTSIPLFILMRRYGLYDTHAALIIPGLTSVYGVFLLRQFFLTIPDDLTDAAKIDGANLWVLYSQIVLPLAKPALSTLAILTFTGCWNEFYRPLVYLNSLERMTIPMGVVMSMGYMGTGAIARVMAAICISVLPVLVVFLFGQRYIVEGITLTGLKG